MTTPRFITRTAFAKYKENEARNALSIIDINLKNDNKLNQFAARALGWSSFEALEARLRRADQCEHSFLVESILYKGVPFFLVRTNNRLFWINQKNLLITTRESLSTDFTAPPMQSDTDEIVSYDTHSVDSITLSDAGDGYATFIATVRGEEHALCFERNLDKVCFSLIFNWNDSAGSVSQKTWEVDKSACHYAPPSDVTYQGVEKAEFDKRTYIA